MPIEFNCQSCGRLMRTPDAAAGKKGKCPSCSATMDIPSASAPQANTPAAPTSDSSSSEQGKGTESQGTSDRIEFPCPKCSQPVRTPVSAAGKKGKCPSCGEVVQIPLESPDAPQTEVKPSAKIQFRCPGCQKRLRMPANVAGKKVKCPACSAVLSIPSSTKKKSRSEAQPGLAPLPDAAPGLAPLDDAPGLAPLDDAPGLAPLDDAPGLVPLDDAPALTPLDDAPGLVPVDESPALMPLDNGPGLTPLDDAPGLEPMDTAAGLTPLDDDPLANAASFEGSAAAASPMPAGASTSPFGDGFGSPTAPPGAMAANPYASPAIASPSYGYGASKRRSSGMRSGAVTSVAVVNFVMAGLQLVCGVAMLAMGGLIGAFAAQAGAEVDSEAAAAVGIASTVVVVYGIVMLVLSALMIVSGVGVLKLANWARVLTLVLGGIYGVLAILSLISLCMGQCGAIVGLLLHGGYCTFVYIVLLNRQYANEFG